MATAQDILNRYGLSSTQGTSVSGVLGKYGLLSEEEKREQDYARTRAQEPVGPPEDLAGRSFLDQAGATLSAFGDYAVGGFADAVAGTARAIGEDPAILARAANPLFSLGQQAGLIDQAAPDPRLTQFGEEFGGGGRAQQAAQTLANAGIEDDSITASLARAGGSVGTMAGSVGAGLLTRSPAIGALAAGAGSYGSAYEEGRDSGLSVEDAQNRALVQSGIEGAAERVGLGYILPRGSGGVVSDALRNPAIAIAAAAGVGAAEETATSLAQMGADEALGYMDYTADDYARAVQDSAVAGGALSGVARAGTVLADRRTSVLPDTGDPAFDAGKNAAATLEQGADTVETTVTNTTTPPQTIPTPKPRYRIVDGTPILIETPASAAAQGETTTILPEGGLATEADLASINQQLGGEQSRIQNSEARNRVIAELSNARDRKTAQAVENLIANGRVQFYGDQGTLPEGADSATDKGYFDGQNIFLNEANLAEGEATAVALHEIKHFMDKQAEQGGAKINRRSLRQFIGNESNTRLNSRISELANTKNRIAQEALEDARFGATDANGNFNQSVFDDEVVPYFLQRAALAREGKRPLGRATAVIKDVVSAAKARIVDLGLDLNLSENDILYLGRQLVGEAAKTATPNNQRQQTGRASLVGPRARNFQQYLDQGIVFEGALDNLPRAEIDDSRTRVKDEGKQILTNRGSILMGALFDHPELYGNYPEIKRTRIRLFTPEEVGSNPNLLGQADASENTISINPKMLNDEQELRRLLLHEGQHIIQSREGFIPGAAPSEFMTEKESASFARADNNLRTFLNVLDRDVLNGISAKLKMPERDKPLSAQKIMNAALKQDRSMESFEPEERAMMNEYQRLAKEWVPLEERRQDSFNRYQRVGGEVEARGVEERMDYSPEDRRDIPFYTTTSTMRGGVPIEDMIDNTRPESGSRFATQRAARRENVGRASRVRPTDPQTQTPEFKRWFGDSKVVDANGNPLVVYHGTGADFTVFDRRKRGSNTREVDARRGFFLSSSPEIAAEYADESKGAPNIIPAYVSLQNPLILEESGKDYDPVRFRDYIEQAEDAGHDGVILRNTADGMFRNGRVGDTVIALRPEQIKSATGNSGEFNPNNPDIRFSRTRPEQPKKVTARVGAAGVEQPTVARRAPVPTQARGVIPESRSKKFVEQKTVTPIDRGLVGEIANVGKTLLAAVAPSGRGQAADVREILERAGGEITVSTVKASQSLNALNKAVNRIPKNKRDAVQRSLVLASNPDQKTREQGIEALKKSYPAVYAQFDSMRNNIRQMGLDAIVSIRDSGKQLTKKDVAVINKIFQNLDSYVTRTYRIDQKGRVAKQQQKETYSAWKKGDRESEGAKIFEDARQYIKNAINIGPYTGIKGKKPKDFQFQSLEQLEALHSEWVSRENAATLPADATEEQRDTYITTMLTDLERVRESMSDKEYADKLDDKATRLTKELVDVVNTGSSKLVQFFRGARQDNTIVSTRSDVPEAIRKLWGEITDPAASLALTLMRQGEFLARQKMLRELYDIGLGRYFVDQKDAKSDVFTERLTGETFGPLEGMYATPAFKESVESTIEPVNSLRKVIEAMTAGRADVAAQGAAALSVGALGKAAALNKRATVVWNPSSWVNNFLGGPSTPIMQGFAPGQGLGRAMKAAKEIIGPTFSAKALGPEAERVLKANLQESGQVGEIQSSTRKIIEETLLSEHRGRLGNFLTASRDKMTDSFAMTDVVWKLSAFFATADWLKGYYKAKGVTRTQEQIDREAAVRVKDRSITFANAAPLVKFTERLGATSYLAYFFETYRVTLKSLYGAALDIIEGIQEGGKAGKMKVVLGIRSAAGASANLAYNRTILPVYEAIGAGVILPSMIALGALEPPDEEEQEKLDVIRKGMSDFYAGKDLTLWRKTDDGKYIFIEPGRVNPNDPATGALAAFASGDPELALQSIANLIFANQGVANALSVGAEVVAGDKAKKPRSAYQTPGQYERLESFLQEGVSVDIGALLSAVNPFVKIAEMTGAPKLSHEINIGMRPETTARVTRVIENYIPKVAQTILRETTEDTGLTGTDKFLAAMGHPFIVFDPAKDLRMTGFRDYKDPVEQARSDFKTAIQTVNPSERVIQDAYLRSARQEFEAFSRMREVVEAAKAAGLNTGEISKVLKEEVQLNRQQIGSLISGQLYQPSFVSPDTLSSSRRQEIQAAKGDQQKIRAINQKYNKINQVIQNTRDEFKAILQEGE